MEIITSIDIQASPAQVWNVFSDFQSYPKWNPFVKKMIGIPKVGETIIVDLPGMQFKPRVLVYEANKEFIWLGHLLFKGLFDGEHRFELKPNADGSTTFIHAEKFAGILVPLFKYKLLTDTKKGFEAMNQKFKEEVEKK
ncbi:MAG: SRPBCC domain-containing protein [Bacteroidota bacterium]